jgi:hypothetical protein
VKGSSSTPTPGTTLGFVAIFLPGLWLYTGFLCLWSTVRSVLAVQAYLRRHSCSSSGIVFTAVSHLFEIGYLDPDIRGGGSLSRDPWWILCVSDELLGGKYFELVQSLAVLHGAVMGLVCYGVSSAWLQWRYSTHGALSPLRSFSSYSGSLL